MNWISTKTGGFVGKLLDGSSVHIINEGKSWSINQRMVDGTWSVMQLGYLSSDEAIAEWNHFVRTGFLWHRNKSGHWQAFNYETELGAIIYSINNRFEAYVGRLPVDIYYDFEFARKEVEVDLKHGISYVNWGIYEGYR